MIVRSQSRAVDCKPSPRPPRQRAAVKSGGAHHDTVCFWPGRSGRLYRFSVHSLIECPAPGQSAYILARPRHGKREALHIGAAASRSATLNLAHIRRRGAKLGAHEVHLFVMTGTTADLRRVVRDLRALVL